MRSTNRLVLALTIASFLSACGRFNEAETRDRVAQFFPLGPTLSFMSKIDCTAGAFRLIDDTIGAEVTVEPGIIGMILMLERRSVVAVDDPALTPDEIMVKAANYSRDRGMAMRRTVLEARACMDEKLAQEFGRLLAAPEAIFAYDSDTALVMIIDHANRVLVVARGSA
ncbi:MAG: hypothetical protein AAF922_03925 [Pseudomonadota bacterium]